MSKPSLFRPFAFYAALAFLAGSLAPAVTAAATTKPSQPNIIFILCDDLGFGDIGVFWQNQRASAGDRTQPHFTTPQIDTMARDGAMLTQHYCAAPVCAPSRASFLTGLTQGHANVRDNQFDQLLADTHTVGSVLQAAGYATAAFGKWGLQGGGEKNRDPDPARSMTERMAEYQTWDSYPTLRGFDYFYGYVRHRDGHFHYPKEEGREVWENGREVSAGLDGCYTTDLFTARAKQWIIDQHKANPDQPFFTYLAFDTPHAVLQNPATAYPAGGGLKGGLKWTGKPGAMINTADGEMDAWMHPDLAGQTWDHDGDPQSAEIAWPDVQKRYANGVRRIDDAVGDVLQLLSDLGIAENTLVVFTSDNGPSRESYLKEDYDPVFFDGFGPFDGIKRDTMEGGMREPTLVRWPARISGGKVENTPSGHWDWLATFADVAGVAPLAAVDGVSLTPLLTGLGSRSAGVIYTEYLNNGSTPNYEEFLPQHRGRKRGQMQALILDGYKGLRYNVQSADDDFEIFDLATDPQEGHNLAGTGKFIALQAKMKARVLQMRRPLESAARPYDVALTPALRVEPKGAAGLAWSRYDGTWPWMPEFRFLQASETGVSSMMGNSLPGASDKPFGLAYTGFVKVPADGTYTLSVASQNTVTVFMHDSRVIDEPIRGATGAVKESIHLAAGWHPIRVYYRHQTGQSGFEILLRDAQSNVINLDQRSLRQ